MFLRRRPRTPHDRPRDLLPDRASAWQRPRHTGVQALTDPVARLGERRAGLFRLRSAPGDEVVSQLALVGLAPSDIRYVVNSHFHFDHCGGNEFFPRSTFLVQRPEMEAAPQVLAALRSATARARSISTFRWSTSW